MTPQILQGKADCKYVPLLAGPLLGAAVYFLLPDSYTAFNETAAEVGHATKATLAVLVWMATWWILEAIDLTVTSLLPLAVFPLIGIMDVKSAAAPYASHLIFLFFGGFSLGLAMQRWGLDRRIALFMLRLVGCKPANMVAGFMLATAFLSAFVTNTATTALMLPIALSVLRFQKEEIHGAAVNRFAVCLLLGIAYSASLGGISTVVGTAPNAFVVGYLENLPGYGTTIPFATWSMAALPVTLLMLPAVWLILTKFIFPLDAAPSDEGGEWLQKHYRELGPMKRGEILTLVVFLTTALLWITRPLINKLSFNFNGEVFHPFADLSDSGISIIAMIALFILPVSRNKAVMDWATALRMPWGVLLLLGGGLSLAAAVQANGVSELLSAQITGVFDLPDFLVLVAVVAIITFATEFASNTATTATLLPVFIALALAFDVPPYLLALPATFAASCAFMMPVATPPNTIIFGSGCIRMPQMVKAGFWINLTAILIVSLIGYFWLPLVL